MVTQVPADCIMEGHGASISTWSVSAKSGALSPTFTLPFLIISAPLDVRVCSGAARGATRCPVNGVLMLGVKLVVTMLSAQATGGSISV